MVQKAERPVAREQKERQALKQDRKDQALAKYRILLVGEPGCGKHCFCMRAMTGDFAPRTDDDYTDPGMLEVATIWTSVVDGQECEIEVIFATVTELTIHRDFKLCLLLMGIHGAIVAYDITSRKSFDAVQDHVSRIRKLVAEEPRPAHFNRVKLPTPNASDFPVVVVGLKKDLAGEKREVRTKEGKEQVQKLDLAGFFETSAKTGSGINEPFSKIVRQMRKAVKDGRGTSNEVDDVKNKVMATKRLVWFKNVAASLRGVFR